MRALKGHVWTEKVIPVASIREGLEIFAGELEAVIRELPELEGQGGGGV